MKRAGRQKHGKSMGIWIKKNSLAEFLIGNTFCDLEINIQLKTDTTRTENLLWQVDALFSALFAVVLHTLLLICSPFLYIEPRPVVSLLLFISSL